MENIKTNLIKSFNFLKINSLSMIPNIDDDWVTYNVRLDSKLEINNEKGHIIATISIITETNDVKTQEEGIRKVLDNLLNENSAFDFSFHKNLDLGKAMMDLSGIDKLEVNLLDPLKSEVEKIFETINWAKINFLKS